ncbi:iron chelate uptake ABC transporter family permease subunit [Stutzerimonas stutzeri]|uniref:iron chelate uptake ABC transporter family permease subunit n=1 Tax=Stutzerimonas stutzeri TaxID=316 RepID=UPI0004BA721C|nr:iron chelate uptake ABC transporter family permease subunit [Stutzerimonas stutzeri]MCQ4331530.1 iron chelate uptake ABC transporter family permease subunit [Stutzerimonas stutzeri]
MLPLCLLLARPLELLTLGTGPASALGLRLRLSQLTTLMLAALLTAAGTLAVGPLSFVGLIAPHIVRQLGVRHAVPQLVLAALIGTLIMLIADWMGRSIAYPWPVSAGCWPHLSAAPIFFG